MILPNSTDINKIYMVGYGYAYNADGSVIDGITTYHGKDNDMLVTIGPTKL